MLAQEILNKKEEQGKHKVYTVHIDTSVFDAISRLDQLKIGSLLVVNDNSELMGIVSEITLLFTIVDSSNRLNPSDNTRAEILSP